MKISKLIKQIVRNASLKFGLSDHNNDTIDVGIYPDDDGEWQVWLQRPTQLSLTRPEIFEEPINIPVHEYTVTNFRIADKTLTGALEKLNECVDHASHEDFNDFITR